MAGLFIFMNKITLPEEYETEVFINSNGGIAITQKGSVGDDIICISSRDRANQLIRALREVLKYADFIPDSEKEESD